MSDRPKVFPRALTFNDFARIEAELEGLHELAKCYREERPPMRDRMIWWKDGTE